MRSGSLLLTLAFSTLAAAGEKPAPVKVFILAGQSNMEGKAKNSVLEYQISQPETRKLYEHLLKNGKLSERDDVWIRYHDVKGNLKIGYHNPKSFGPEVGFGWLVGDRYKEPVLLIKSAWGGRSLYRDFRSPSAGLPPDVVLEKTLAAQQKKNPKMTLDDVKKPYGSSYREMMKEVETTLADLKSVIPDYAGQGHELCGFVWFQGWNDMIDKAATDEYTVNLKHFINDVRKDLISPKLPFVIGEMGVDGVKAEGNVKRFKAAQAAVMDYPEFKGNVAVVKTDALWDLEADAIFRKGWRENIVEWNKVGSDFPYHYLGSPKCMLRMGQAFGEAMLELLGEKKSGR
jgi:hypothetical protein